MRDSKKSPPGRGPVENLAVDILAGSGTSTMQTIAQRIYTARIAAGMTQRELAGTEFSKSYISAIERGKMIPSIPALTVLAHRLQVRIAYLVGEDTMQQAHSEKEATMRLGRAEALIRQDQPHSAWEALGDEPTEDISIRQRLTWYWLAGWALTSVGRHEEAIRFLTHGLDLVELLLQQEPHDPPDWLDQLAEWLHCFLGMAYCGQGQTYLAIKEHRHGLVAIEEQKITDPELLLLIFKSLGRDYLVLGHSRDAAIYYKRAVKQAADINNTRQLVITYWGLGVAYQESGDLDNAWIVFQDALQIVGLEENWRLVAQIRGLLGEVLTKLRYYDQAEEELRKSLAGVERLNDSASMAHVLLALAALYLAKNNLEEATRAINLGMQHARNQNDLLTEGQLYLTLARIYAAQHNTATAEQMLKQAITLLEPLQVPVVLRQGYEQYARFLADQGCFEEAYAQMCLASTRATG